MSSTSKHSKGEVVNHNFTKAHAGTTCALCKNMWSSKDKVTSKYQICGSCGTNVHTNCRSIAQICFPCTERLHISYSQNFRFEKITGWLFVKIIHIYDVSVAPGTPMYAQVRLKHGTQCLRSVTAESGNNDCVWAKDSDVPVEHSSLKFHINQGAQPSEGFKADLNIEVEIWSTFLAFFDTCLAATELTVCPVLLYPNIAIERWFTLTNKATAEGTMTEGKLLLSMSFQPAAMVIDQAGAPTGLTSPKAESASTLGGGVVGARSRGASVASLSDSKTTEVQPLLPAQHRALDAADLLAADAMLTTPEKARPPVVPQGSPRSGEKHEEQREQTPSPQRDNDSSRTASAVSSPTQVKRSRSTSKNTLETTHRGGHSQNHSHGSGNHAHIETHWVSAEDPDQAPALSSGGGSGTSEQGSVTEVPVTAPVLPVTDLYQTIAEFTERTTNTLGTFFYEMESLGLTAGKKDAVDGDWHDNNGGINLASSSIRGATDLVSGNGSGTTSTKGIDNAPPPLGVGYMHIRIVSAFKSKVRDAADGDHYLLACVEDSKREFRSRTVHRSATPIFNVRWTIKMEHYRAAVVVFLMDAHTHRRIASTRFSCYALMQRDADRQYANYKDAPLEKMPLRGVNDNEEMGYLNAQVGFEEDLEHLFLGDTLRDAPTSPPEQLSVQRLGEHIARFTAIIELVNLWYAEYVYLMEWQEPLTTLVVFLVFLFFTLRVKAEYALSGVMFTVVVLMTRTLMRRRAGTYVKHYVERGAKGAPKLDYKPIAQLRLAVLGFRSGDPKTPLATTKPSMRVSFQYVPETAAQADLGPEEHVVGYFGPDDSGVGFAMPETAQGVTQLVSNMVGGAEVLQKDAVVQSLYAPWPIVGAVKEVDNEPSRGLFVPTEHPELSLLYPVLQPIAAKVQAATAAVTAKVPKSDRTASGAANPSTAATSSSSTTAPSVSSVYLPWDRNDSIIKITFTVDHHGAFGGGPEEVALLTLKDIAQSGMVTIVDGRRMFEIRKWCRITRPRARALAKTESRSELDMFAYDSASSIYMSAPGDGDNGIAMNASVAIDGSSRRAGQLATSEGAAGMEVLVRAQLEIPHIVSLAAPTVEEQEKSIVLQSLLSKDAEKESSTISVLWNMTDNVKYVQNLMNWLLDQIESVKNIFNWTAPHKTYPIYLAIVALWLVTIFVPGRLLILAVGLYEFFFVFLPIPEGRNTVIRFSNLIQSIPNDDDINQIYATERKAFAAAKLAEWKQTERARKISLLVPTHWKGAVGIKGSSLGGGVGGGGAAGMTQDWVRVFLLLQGHRLVWWASEEALDTGKPPAGQLVLCGHSGITQVSPVDIRKQGGDARLMAIFGQDYVGRPQKLAILFDDAEAKAALHRVLECK